MTDLIPFSIDQLTYQLQIANKILFCLLITMVILTLTLIVNLIFHIFQKKKNKKQLKE